MTDALINPATSFELLCETCGYGLTGLGSDSNCPECGTPARLSDPSHRGRPAWEKPGAGFSSFITTSAEVLFHTQRFYRKIATRLPRARSYWFAQVHWIIASLLMGIGVYIHARTFRLLPRTSNLDVVLANPFSGIILFSAAVLLSVEGITLIAARLSAWEATYRSMRLPLNVVSRGMDYHAAHYLPVALITSATMVGSAALPFVSDTLYIYLLCGEVVVGAVYLFWTYWIAMRNMMYANA